MLGSILRKLENRERLNILTIFAHERYDEILAKTGHNFMALKNEEGCRNNWDTRRSNIPKNYSFVSRNVLSYIDFDLIISGNPFAHLPILTPISKQLNIPIISLYHTCAPIGWRKENFNHPMFNCAKHIFITETNSIEWTGKIGDVIPHGIDCDQFFPKQKENYSLTVCNDFLNRQECGFPLWNFITEGTERKVIGDTPGLSVGAESFDQLVNEFGKAAIYVNSSLRSPIPMSLMEAGSSGCAIVTTNTCSIPDYFEHEKSALIFSPSKPEDGKEYLSELLVNEKLRNQLSRAARSRMEEFTIEKFVAAWNKVLYEL